MTKTQTDIILFSDVQRAVLQTSIMRLSLPESLAWLTSQGHKMGKTIYFKTMKEIHKIKDFTILQIASRGLFEQHMERIQNLELVLKLSWRNYHKLSASDPYKSQKILDSIAMQQPMLSQYYEATKFVNVNKVRRHVRWESLRGIFH